MNTFESFIAGIALSNVNYKGSGVKKSRELTYHDATGLGERSTSTKHILERMKRVQGNHVIYLCSPTVARNCKSIMIAKPVHIFDK